MGESNFTGKKEKNQNSDDSVLFQDQKNGLLCKLKGIQFMFYIKHFNA